MIKQIQISNFQSHKSTTLELDLGVNVIVGSSDSGKTAIIRALRWLVWNRPGGEAFRSHWGGDTMVELETNDAFISRSKGKANRYELNDTSFEAFGTDVPKEIQQVLNLSEINLQSQLDSPFLLSDSAGEVAQHFNRVARLDKIDSAQQMVQRWIRELTSDIKYVEGQEKKLQEDLTKFDHLQKFEIEVEVLEDTEKQRKNMQSRFAKLDKLNWDIIETGAYIAQESDKLKIEPLLDKVLKQIENRNELKNKSLKLQSLLSNLHMNYCEQDSCGMYVKLEKPVLNVLGLINTRKPLLPTFSTLNKLLSSINSIDTLLKEKSVNLSVESALFKKEMGDTCLLCGSKLKN